MGKEAATELADRLRALAMHGVFPTGQTDRAARDAADMIERQGEELERLSSANATLTDRRLHVRHALLKAVFEAPESDWDEGWNAASRTVIALIDAQDHGTVAAEIAEMRRAP